MHKPNFVISMEEIILWACYAEFISWGNKKRDPVQSFLWITRCYAVEWASRWHKEAETMHHKVRVRQWLLSTYVEYTVHMHTIQHCNRSVYQQQGFSQSWLEWGGKQKYDHIKETRQGGGSTVVPSFVRNTATYSADDTQLVWNPNCLHFVESTSKWLNLYTITGRTVLYNWLEHCCHS